MAGTRYFLLIITEDGVTSDFATAYSKRAAVRKHINRRNRVDPNEIEEANVMVSPVSNTGRFTVHEGEVIGKRSLTMPFAPVPRDD